MPRRVQTLLLALGVAALLAPTPTTAGAAPRAAATELGPGSQPNVVLIMTDDMAKSDLKWMPKTRRLLGRAGMTFEQGLAPNPLCCPARASLLTGQESHNNGVWANTAAHGGYGALSEAPRLPEWLQAAGYRTALLGKHLNNYKSEDAAEEPGWDILDPLVRGVYAYRSFVTWDDGRLHRERGYVTSYLERRTEQVIRKFDRSDSDPFFLWVSHVGPHNAHPRRCTTKACWTPPVPAEQDQGDFAGVRSPTRDLPSYNSRNRNDKPPFMRELPRVSAAKIDETFQRRIESLKSVDRSVAATVQQLRESGELDKTMLVFTSDHGYLLGQHRYKGKRLPYEDSLRVPLLVRGPGVPAGATTDHLTTTVDLNRTIADLADATAPYPLDGASMVPALTDPTASPARTSTILQTGAQTSYEGDGSGIEDEVGDQGWLYRGYRDDRYTYVRYPDGSGESTEAFEELYDRRRDRYQLDNVAGDEAYADVLAQARTRAEALRTCLGATCHQAWEPLPGPR